MLIENISATVVTLAGQFTISPGGTLTIPYSSLEFDRNFIGYVDAQQLRILDAEESFTLNSLPRFSQNQLFPAQTLTAGQVYTPMTNNGSTPVLLWLAPFQNSRLYLYVSTGELTMSITDSPDGGATFFPVPDFTAISAASTTAGGVTTPGQTSVYLPRGLCLIAVTLTGGSAGGTGYVAYSRQS